MTALIESATRVPTERVIVVSLMKSGTHLIQELMVALGYGMYGQSRIPSEIGPVLDSGTRRQIAEMVYDKDILSTLESASQSEFLQGTDRAWEALGWAWQMKFGMPLANRYGAELVNTELIRQAQRRTAASDFSDTPGGVCWILPEFDIKKIDGRFLQEWSRTGQPRIIFNYRDPRDVVLSMVNFLSGKTAAGFGTFSEFQAFSRILDAKPTIEDKLAYALTDSSFPGYGDFEKASWLLNHPDVCKVSFEEMVGPQGGGSVESQRRAVARILDFLGAEVAPDNLTNRLFRRDSFSFFKGQIGGWRTTFTFELERLFLDRFGDVLTSYGYERSASPATLGMARPLNV